jgi:hypothetical protein
METLCLTDINTSSIVEPPFSDKVPVVSAVISFPPNLALLKTVKLFTCLHELRTEMIGTIVKVNKPVSLSQTTEEEYETDNDDYEIIAKAPIIKSFKVKVKIKSVKRFQSKVFID